MVKRRKGLAVMRRVSRHPNVSPESLVRLALGHDPYVPGDVAMNKATPMATLERLFERRNSVCESYLIDWGLARNPATPQAILRALAPQSQDQHTQPLHPRVPRREPEPVGGCRAHTRAQRISRDP